MAVRNIERDIEELRRVCSVEPRDRAVLALRKALGDKVNLVAAKAASLIAQLKFVELTPELLQAFERFLQNAAKSDPQCRAKDAIIKALKDLAHAESAVFVKGAQHVQWEPVWGGQEDTAHTLRGNSTLALLHCRDITREKKFEYLISLLTERSASLRKDAALALGDLNGSEAALLLRLKARLGDSDSNVTGQIFESLLNLQGEMAVPFVAGFLSASDSAVREEAALALGAARLPSAIEYLTPLFDVVPAPVDWPVLYRALALSRCDQALEFLLDAVGTERPGEAAAALEALALFPQNEEHLGRVKAAVARRTDDQVNRTYQRLFAQA
jgi:HEAT repeat protein